MLNFKALGGENSSNSLVGPLPVCRFRRRGGPPHLLRYLPWMSMGLPALHYLSRPIGACVPLRGYNVMSNYKGGFGSCRCTLHSALIPSSSYSMQICFREPESGRCTLYQPPTRFHYVTFANQFICRHRLHHLLRHLLSSPSGLPAPRRCRWRCLNCYCLNLSPLVNPPPLFVSVRLRSVHGAM